MLVVGLMSKIVNQFPTLEHECFLIPSYDVMVRIPVFVWRLLLLKTMTSMVVVVVVAAVSTWVFFYLTWIVNRNVSASMYVSVFTCDAIRTNFLLWTETGTTEQDQAIFLFFSFSLSLSVSLSLVFLFFFLAASSYSILVRILRRDWHAVSFLLSLI